LGLVQPVVEPAVGQAVLARRRVNARNPQPPELTLARPAVAVRVLQRLHDLLVGNAVIRALAAAIAFGHLQDTLATTPGNDAGCSPRHTRQSPLTPSAFLTRRAASSGNASAPSRTTL